MKKLLTLSAILIFMTMAAFTQTSDLISDYLAKAKNAVESSDFISAVSYYEKLIELQIQDYGEKSAEVATSYNDLGAAYYGLQDYDNTLSYFEKAYAIRFELFGDENPDTATSYNNIGYIYGEKGDYDRALNYHEKALNIRLKILGENHGDTATSYNNLGYAYYGLQDYDNALSYFEKAYAIRFELFGDENPGTAASYNNIGYIYGEKGDYDRALNYYEKALNIELKILGENHGDTAVSYDNIGYIYGEKGDYDRALNYYEKALNIRLKILGENHSDTAISYNNIGSIYGEKGDYDRALNYHEKALNIRLKILGENHPGTAISYNNIGYIYDEKDDYDRALNYYEKALNIRLKILGENHGDTAISYNHIARVYYEKEDKNSAMSYLQKAYTVWKNASGDYDFIIKNLTDIAFQNLPDPSFTRETLTLATDTVERARLDLSSMRTDIMRKSLPIYYYGVQFEAEQKNPKKAFEYSESLRSRGFLDQLGTETALKLDGITDEERKTVQDLSAKITSSRKTIEAQNSLPLSERDEKLLAQAGNELSQAEKSLLKLDEKIGKRIPAYAQLRNPKPVSAGEAQKWCGKKRTVLEYVLWNPDLTENKDAKIKSYCIVLTNKKVHVVELDGEYDYAGAINKLRKALTDLKRESQFEGVRNELYEKLISPVLPYIAGGTKELVIVPDGNLSFLPFDVLRKDEDSKVLGDKYAIAFSPSVSVSVLSGNKKAAEKRMLAFGGAWYDTRLSADSHRANFTAEGISRGAKRGQSAVNFDSGDLNEKQLAYMKNDIKQNGLAGYFSDLKWQDLPGTITELNALKNGIFTSGAFSEVTQERASEKTVKELSKDGTLAQFPILHFACHGYFDTKIADMSSVLFSEVSGSAETNSTDDGYLTIPETAVLKLNADLVCLSACETGLGEMKAGDGMVGLSRAFMVAGAQQVGASLWCVDDEATAKFMSAMYEKVIKKGMDYVTAYQKTKAEFRKSEDFDHPYYWAAFVLYE